MKKTKSIAFRSELDALPIKENNTHIIKSKNENMHACGHDIHTSALLKLGEYINGNNFKYNIVLIFQSKEETGLGSKDIIDSNILDEFNIKNIFAIHVWPQLEYDELHSAKNLMFGSYELDVLIKGKSNHVSSYQQNTDAIYASYLIYKKLYINTKNQINHLGQLNAGAIRNISADKAFLHYTIRFKTNNSIKEKIIKTQIETNCKITYNFKEYYPPIINSKKLLKLIKHKEIATLKSAEDFGYYQTKYNTLYLLYGLGKGDFLHTHNFTTTEKQRLGYYNKLIYIIEKFK